MKSSTKGKLRRFDQQASMHVEVTSVQRRPRAIVVVLGWMGAEKDQMSEYTSIYHDRNCSTVSAVVPFVSLATSDETIISEVGVTVCRECARLIRMGELTEMGFGRIPLFIHVLGHGGAQVLEQLERTVRDVVSFERSEESSRASSLQSIRAPPPPFFSRSMRNLSSSKSLALSSVSSVTERTDVFEESDDESGPCNQPWLPAPQRSSSFNMTFPPCLPSRPELPRQQSDRSKQRSKVRRLDSERSARRMPQIPTYNQEERAYERDMELFSSRVSIGTIIFDSAPCFPSIQSELKTAEVCLGDRPMMKLVAKSVITVAMGSSLVNQPPIGRAEQFWNTMQELSLSKRQAFVYSEADQVCDHKELKAFVEEKRRRGVSVMESVLVGSGHLEHRQQCPELYTMFLDSVLGAVCPTSSAFDDDWWSDEQDEDEDHKDCNEQGTRNSGEPLARRELSFMMW